MLQSPQLCVKAGTELWRMCFVKTLISLQKENDVQRCGVSQLWPVFECFQPFHWEAILLLLFIVNLSYVTEIWKLPKMYSTEQHQKTGRKGERQRGGGKCQGSFAKQIENYPFV